MIANINIQTIKGWNRAIIDRWPAVIFSADFSTSPADELWYGETS